MFDETEWRSRAREAAYEMHGIISGPSACRLWGGQADFQPHLIHVTVDPDSGYRDEDGRVIHRQRIGQGEFDFINDTPVTTPLRTVEDCAIHASHLVAVICIETLARLGLVTLAEIGRKLADRGPWGTAKLRSAMLDADLRSESGTETELRLLLQPHLPRLEPQVTVHHEGRSARLDLADEATRTGLEANGREFHVENFEYDQDRRLFLKRADWEVLDFTPKRIRSTPAYVVRSVLEVVAQRRASLGLT